MTIRLAVCALALSLSLVPAVSFGHAKGTTETGLPASFHVLRAADYDAMTRIPAPPALRGEGVPTKTADIQVQYVGFSTQAQAAFQRAVDIWSSILDSDVTIRIQAFWSPLGQGILGGAGAFYAWNFSGSPDNQQTFYPYPLADAFQGADVDPSRVDIQAQFNSSGIPWYLGTDGNAPAGQFDLVTVVLHEIGHGLGFASSFGFLGNLGTWGFVPAGQVNVLPYIYDRFVQDANGTPLIDTQTYPNPSAALANAMQSNAVFWGGPRTVMAAGGTRPPLFAPNPWLQGSSLSHFDENTYPPGQPGSLMTPALAMSEVVHTPDDLFLCLLEDLGWQTTAQCDGSSGCRPGPTTMCLNGGRFRVTVNYETAQGATGDGQVAQGVGTDDSGIFYFFNPQNYEMLIKVLDNCQGFSNRFWVFAAGTTDLGWEMTVEDTQTGQEQFYSNPLGRPSPAITDTQAFATCP